VLEVLTLAVGYVLVPYQVRGHSRCVTSPCGGGIEFSTVVLQVERGEEKGKGYKYGDLALQAGGVPKETTYYDLSSTGLRPESDCSGKAQKQLYK
jgi:hypothetical protein